MKIKKKDKAFYFNTLSLILLTIYIIADNNFAIYQTSIPVFIFNLGFLLLAFAVSFFINIVIHELGHLIFGFLASYKFSSFRVLNFMFIKENGKLKVKKLHIPGTAGQCLMKPVSSQMSLTSAIVYNLGGGLFNIMISSILLFLHKKYFITTDYSIYSRTLYAVGYFAAISNLLPLKISLISNDGYNALMLWKNKNYVRYFNEALMIQDLLTQSHTFDQIPKELLSYNSNLDYNNPILTGNLAFYYQSLLDMQAYEKAYQLNQSVLKDYPQMIDYYKNYFKTNLLFFDILKMQGSEDLFYRFKEHEVLAERMPNDPSLSRVEYAYHSLIKVNQNKAEKAATNFKRFLEINPFEADIKIEKQLFNLVNKTQENRTKSIEQFID